MVSTYSYNKTEKLKSRKALNNLFASGKSVSVFPVKVFYLMEDDGSAIKAGVGVSARNFKKATDRNRIKRLLRECYRLNKQSLHAAVTEKQKTVSVFFLFIGKELPEYATLNEKMIAVMKKLETLIIQPIVKG